nr:helix-turn-helix domain-containing protein [Halopiger djelfimassiliensis]
MEPPNDDEDKKNRFREAFERGQQGHVGSYDVWLTDHGFQPEQVSREQLTDYFRNHPEKAANQEDELDEIAEYAGFVTRQQDIFHIPVVGPSGIGKTQLLHTVVSFLTELPEDIDTKLIDATEPGKKVDDGFLLDQFANELAGFETPVVCIDDCGLDKRIRTSLTEFRQAVDSGLFVTTWTPERWTVNRDRIHDVLPPAKEIHLDAFPREDTQETLSVLFDVLSEDGFSLPAETAERIHALSEGIPRLIHILAVESLQEAFRKELEPGDVAATNAAAKRLHLANASTRVQELSDSKLAVLKQILQLPNDRGVQPGTLVDELHRDKSTISYHLRELSESGFVERDREGRRAFYRVTETMAPLIQQRINQEAEFNG